LLAPFLRSPEREILALLRLRSMAPPMQAMTLRAPQIVLMICIKASHERCEDVSNSQVFRQEVVRYVPFEARRSASENARDVGVAFALLLAIALAQAIHAAAVGTEIRHLGKAICRAADGA